MELLLSECGDFMFIGPVPFFRFLGETCIFFQHIFLLLFVHDKREQQFPSVCSSCFPSGHLLSFVVSLPDRQFSPCRLVGLTCSDSPYPTSCRCSQRTPFPCQTNCHLTKTTARKSWPNIETDTACFSGFVVTAWKIQTHASCIFYFSSAQRGAICSQNLKGISNFAGNLRYTRYIYLCSLCMQHS